MDANLLIDKKINSGASSFAPTMRNPTSRRRRDDIDRLRTMCWYEHIRSTIGCASAYAVEKWIEPEAFYRSRELRYHRNKWPSFRSGKHTPSPALVDRAELREPGSRHIIQHPLWTALRVERPIGTRGTELLRGLSPGVMPILFRATPGGIFKRAEFRPLLLKQIERNVSLDTLAALTIMLREAMEGADDHRTDLIVRSTFRVLLAYSAACDCVSLRDLLLSVYARSVFSSVRIRGSALRLDLYGLSEAMALLDLELQVAQARGPTLVGETRAKFLLNTFMRGIHRLLAYMPLFGPLDPGDSNADERLRENIARQQSSRRLLHCVLEDAVG